jgi:hypothetical protein
VALSSEGTVNIGGVELKDVSKDYLMIDIERRLSLHDVINGSVIQDFGMHFSGQDVSFSGNEYRSVLIALNNLFITGGLQSCQDVWGNVYTAIILNVQIPGLMGSNPRMSSDELYPYSIRMYVTAVTQLLGTSVT